MSRLSDVELIERFMANTLSEEERAIFADREQDESFKALLDEAIVKAAGRSALKQQLKQISADYEAPAVTTKRRSIGPLKGLLVAASVAILGLLAVQFFLPKSLSSDSAFQTYYKPYPDITTQRGSVDSTLARTAMERYSKADYVGSIQAFEEVASLNKLSPLDSFYYGQALLANQQTNEALPFFDTTTKHLLREEATWYFMLTLLKTGQKEEAISLAQQIADDPSLERQQEAAALLKKLK
ncbi:MAG: hypothetical protein KTR13_07060 [Saprospiraceae bacterium]|nr:hypothetical protein [Saprospiraceae bacterium]